MIPIVRTHCAISGNADLEPLYTFTQFPVFMGCTTKPREEDILADMDWGISRGSGLIQLRQLIPLDVLYPESHGSGSVGVLWEQHHAEFAEFIRDFEPSGVLEIGGAHGILARNYATYSEIPWTILEPNPSPVPGCPAVFIKQFFNEKFTFDGKVDAVIHSHLFEHIYEPRRFMQSLSNFTDIGQRLIFSLPNMEVMLRRRYTNCINFEHTLFLTEAYVEFLLSSYGFALERKKYFKENHSIFYAARRSNNPPTVSLSEKLYEENLALYNSYIEYHRALILDINYKIQSVSKPIYLFGAHVFAQYLIAFGLDTNKISCILDNDSRKHGKRLYGTNLMVDSPRLLKDKATALVILKAGVYNDEVRDEILSKINPAVEFLE
jgi:hypothetical protein